MSEADELCFFALLRAGLWDREADASLFGHSVDWKLVMEHGRKQTVLGVLADGIGKLPQDLLPPLAVRRRLQQELLMIRQGHIRLNHVLNEVWGKLVDAGVRSVLLKGQGMAQNYIYPEQRQCGDIDLYVGEEQYDAACRVMELYGSVDGLESESFLHRHFHRNGITVEIHRIAAYMSEPSSNKYFQELTCKYLKDGECGFGKLRGSGILLPPANFDAIFVFYHFVRHFVDGGIGLRQICDWMLCLHVRKDEIDRERLMEEVRLLGLERFWRLFGCIAVDYLGLPKDEFPGYVSLDKKMVKRAVGLIFEAGNFGHYFYDASRRPKGYYSGKLFTFYYFLRWKLRILAFEPSIVSYIIVKIFWQRMKVALLHR